MVDSAQEKQTSVMIPDIEWVKVPAGEFPNGLGREQKMIDLDEFYISRYPITNRQFECFELAGGYQQNDWWAQFGDIKQPAFKRSTWPQPTRPKTDVSWYEAMAFCKWLTDVDLSKPLPEITLPHEQQWEKAACGGHKAHVFAWGSEDETNIENYANVVEKLGQTSVVGMYPLGDASVAAYYQDSPGSDDGGLVSDLSGNVWEWCRNGYDDDEAMPSPDNRAVLRGGSWIDVKVIARARFRYRSHPQNLSLNVGFRVVCSLPEDR